MKKPLSNIARRFWHWGKRNSITTALTLLASCGLSAHAQDAVPYAADVQTIQIQLSSGETVTLKYSINGNNLFYFPVVGLKQADLIVNGGTPRPFADAKGNLLLPGSPSDATLCVTLYDYLKNVPMQNEILNNLRTNALIVSTPPGPAPRLAAVQPIRLARLVLADPAMRNQRRVLAESLLTDSDGYPEPKASFFLGSDALAALRAVREARFVNVEIEQAYRAQFFVNDVEVTVHAVSSSLASTLGSLTSVRDGSPTLLLSPRLPLQLPPGGTVDRDIEFNSRVGREVRISVYTRDGYEYDPELVQRLTQTALDQATLQLMITTEERQRAVATILLDDGLSLTLPLARLSEIAADMHTDNERRWESSFKRAIQRQGSVEVYTDATVLVGIFGGDFSTDVITRWNNHDYVSRKLSDFSRQIQDMSVRVAGEIPVLTGLRFTDSGTVINVDILSLQQVVGRFTNGPATLLHQRNFMDYVNRLAVGARVEALLVQRTEVGMTNAPASSGWPILNGTTNYFDIPIRFSRAFAQPPNVIASISAFVASSQSYLRLHAEAQDVRQDGFTLRLWSKTGGGYSVLYGVSASWTATGEVSMQTPTNGTWTSIGLSGSLPLIPGELREQLLTPNLECAPSWAENRMRASFNAIPGRTYTVETSADLAHWSPLTTVLAEDFAIAFSVPMDASEAQQFYRLATP